MNTLTDWRGRTISPGATVLYVGRFSSTVYVTEGTVLEVFASGTIRVQPVASTRWATPEGPSTLTALKNVTVLEEASAREEAWDKGAVAAHRSPLTLFAIKQTNPYRQKEETP